MPVYTTTTADETCALGKKLADGLTGGEVIAFRGGLGAGKTTFCKGIAKGLGSQDPVTSPTFSIVNLYGGRVDFAHFDAYRITGEQDLEAAGFYDYHDQGAVVAVEWSENITPLLPLPYIWVDIQTEGPNRRRISIEGASWL